MESRIQSQAERTQYNDVKSLLCCTLIRVLRKVEPADIPLIALSILFLQVLQMESRIQSQAERTQYNDLQSLLCSTLQRVLRKVEPADAPLISDSIMRALLQMFQSSVNNKTGGVQEDALMAVSTLVEVLGKLFF